jgi:aryl-alcohol dehydrogenase-like predicted oxidoreductase
MTIAKRTINGRSVNPVGLGCMSLSWAYGSPPTDAEGAKLLHRALDLGYDHFDTANIYGLGHNETLIGNTLRKDRDKFFLATKTGIFVEGPNRGIDCSPQAIRASIDASLTRLQTDHVDLFYMHRFDPKVPIADSVGAMAELVKAGKIGAIGLSEWSASHIREANAIHPIAAVQTEYSLWTRNAEIAVLDTTRELGITFVAFSPVGRGALANGVRDIDALPAKDLRHSLPRFSHAHWPANLALIDQFNAMAAEQGVTPAQLSLTWVLSRGDHIVAIPGTAHCDHVQENIARWDWQIPSAVASALDKLINQHSVSGPRYPTAIQNSIDTEEFTL